MWAQPSPGKRDFSSLQADSERPWLHPPAEVARVAVAPSAISSSLWVAPPPTTAARESVGASASSSSPWVAPPPCSSGQRVRGSALLEQVHKHHLSLVSVMMIEPSKEDVTTTYAQNSMDAKRVHRVFPSGCSCGCLSLLRESEVVAFCQRLFL